MYVKRDYSQDKKLLKYTDDIDERVLRASVIWIRQDLAQAYGVLTIIAGLLGAILFILIIKL